MLSKPVNIVIPPTGLKKPADSLVVIAVFDNPGGDASDNGIGRYIFGDDSTSEDNCSVRDSHSSNHLNTIADPAVIADFNRRQDFFKTLLLGKRCHRLLPQRVKHRRGRGIRSRQGMRPSGSPHFASDGTKPTDVCLQVTIATHIGTIAHRTLEVTVIPDTVGPFKGRERSYPYRAVKSNHAVPFQFEGPETG